MYVYTIAYIRKSASICGACVRVCVCVLLSVCQSGLPAPLILWVGSTNESQRAVQLFFYRQTYATATTLLLSVRSFACFLFDFVFVLLTICCGVCVCTCSFWNNSNENAQRQKVLQIKKEGTLLQRLQQQQQHQLYNLKKRLQTSFVCACKARA